MIEYLTFLAVGLFILGLLILYILKQQVKHFGILNHKIEYYDTDKKPGQTMYAKSVSLVGKPDYIIHKDGFYIPIEHKSSRAPQHPYKNHTMQLMAYCLLVEENYDITPPGGYIKYSDYEFYIEYSPKDKEEIQLLVNEILQKKKTNEEQHCNHAAHYKN